jgi:hypothetical protein
MYVGEGFIQNLSGHEHNYSISATLIGLFYQYRYIQVSKLMQQSQAKPEYICPGIEQTKNAAQPPKTYVIM